MEEVAPFLLSVIHEINRKPQALRDADRTQDFRTVWPSVGVAAHIDGRRSVSLQEARDVPRIVSAAEREQKGRSLTRAHQPVSHSRANLTERVKQLPFGTQIEVAMKMTEVKFRRRRAFTAAEQ